MLFPQEFIERSVEHVFKRSSVRSQLLYILTLIFILCIFCALPFVYTEVGKSAQGVLVPSIDRMSVLAPKTGRVATTHIAENLRIEEGQLLLTFQTQAIDQQLEKNQKDLNRTILFIQDLELIVRDLQHSDSPKLLHTALYNSEWASYLQERNELLHEITNQQQLYNRTKALYEKEAVSKAELEQGAYQLEVQRQRLSLLTQRRLMEWESALNTHRLELETLKTKHIELLDHQKAHYVYAPITGTLQNAVSITKHSMLYANQVLSEISPDTLLIAEMYVHPRDIGFIEKGMPVRFQIDAFNYNEWGHVKGKVLEVPNDATITEHGDIVFMVRCTLNSTKLTLSNGYTASLIKGMTLQAQFIIARRSLFQLLYDNVDDWLNPIRNQASN